MRTEKDTLLWKIGQLTSHAQRQLNVAVAANEIGDRLQWRVKVLQAFDLIDLAWRVANGTASEADDENAFYDFETLQSIMSQRMKAMLSESKGLFSR